MRILELRDHVEVRDHMAIVPHEARARGASGRAVSSALLRDRQDLGIDAYPCRFAGVSLRLGRTAMASRGKSRFLDPYGE